MADDALALLCHRLGLDPEAAGRAVTAATGGDSPWYLRVATGIGAWVTAAAMIVAVGLVVGQTFGEESLPLTAAGFGVAIAAGAVALHRASRGEFATQYAVAAALAGQALVAGGLGIEHESMTVAAVFAGVAAALLAVTTREQELQFLSCALAVGTILGALLEAEAPQPGGILVAVTLPVAFALLVRPPAGFDLRGLAWALLLVPLGALSMPEIGGINAGWLPRAAYAGGLVAALALVWRAALPERRPMVAVAGAVAVLVGGIAGAGIAGSLMLLTLAYLLGSRMLAVLGVVAHVWLVSQFYYDLDLTLLEKSGTLTATGALLLALWWAWTRFAGEEAGDG